MTETGMTRIGKFLIKKFKGKKLDIFTSNENEYVHYADTDMFSWTIVRGILIDYDEESGVLTLETLSSGTHFYLNEFKVELFWQSGLDYGEIIGSTANLNKGKSKDFM